MNDRQIYRDSCQKDKENHIAYLKGKRSKSHAKNKRAKQSRKRNRP